MRHFFALLLCLTSFWQQSLATYGFQCSANFGTPLAFDCWPFLKTLRDTIHDDSKRLRYGMPESVNSIKCSRRYPKLWKYGKPRHPLYAMALPQPKYQLPRWLQCCSQVRTRYGDSQEGSICSRAICCGALSRQASQVGIQGMGYVRDFDDPFTNAADNDLRLKDQSTPVRTGT